MPLASNETLRDRARMFAVTRNFFDKRNVLEVDCPFLSRTAPVDAHIDIFEVLLEDDRIGYLHSSPEYGMKRLLARGIGPIYQLSHVYRKGEIGKKHQPEFTMIEWYRPDTLFKPFIEEVIAYIALFLGTLPYEVTTYKKVFLQHAHIDPFTAPVSLFKERLTSYGIATEQSEEEVLENLLWGCAVEPCLGKEGLTIVTDYPAAQAALATTRTTGEGDETAERFEIYLNGMELGNGYHELTDPVEQEKRLHVANKKRLSLGKKALPIDTLFLAALKKGIPESYGIAVGFDRLMMLRRKTDDITSVMPIEF